MAKFTPEVLQSGYLSSEVINSNFNAIAAILETLLSRDGTLPNSMEADLDLNGHTILNSFTDPNNPSAIVTIEELHAYVDARASGLLTQHIETQTSVAGQTMVTLTEISYELGTNNMAVYVDGVRFFPGVDYAEVDESTFQLYTPLADGQQITAVSTNFLATTLLPAHTHTWSQIISPPATATRWPTYAEVTDKPATFAPSAHVHSTDDITSGNGLADARRGVWVQSGTPTATRVGDLWFW